MPLPIAWVAQAMFIAQDDGTRPVHRSWTASPVHCVEIANHNNLCRLSPSVIRGEQGLHSSFHFRSGQSETIAGRWTSPHGVSIPNGRAGREDPPRTPVEPQERRPLLAWEEISLPSCSPSPPRRGLAAEPDISPWKGQEGIGPLQL